MMTIAEMYKRSGGCDRLHECHECDNFVKPDSKSRYKTCGIHPQRPEVWKESWMACRFFRNKKLEEKKEEEHFVPLSRIEEEAALADEWGSQGEHQITIDEFLETLT